ncbi:MAG: hypothetical protein QOK29_1901, partial [Rhodospirillaceae bacterium]|nr:hypothetical protein [Rhodospirillaceae bacterium]
MIANPMTSRSTINVTFSPALPAGLHALIVGVAESGEILVPAGAVSDGLAEAVARARRAAPGFKSAPEQLLDIMGHAESDVARIFAAGFGGRTA